ncbi:MAG TPA: hypothetical protein PKM25_15720, partial [Candidatus Ozemobacteraceae bacterium]|nr:hypothetical protein [Candidatus Ozemobacteraceae bacterium]
MMRISGSIRERVAALSAVITLIALVLGLGCLGCRIIEPYWGDNTDDGLPGQIGRYTIAGGTALDVRSGEFRLVIPSGAARDGTTFSIFQAIEPSLVLYPQQDQDKVSKILPPDGFVK